MWGRLSNTLQLVQDKLEESLGEEKESLENVPTASEQKQTAPASQVCFFQYNFISVRTCVTHVVVIESLQ